MDGIAVAMKQAQTVGHAEEMIAARSNGALYHATNSEQDWFCLDCGVFGHGDNVCWSCEGERLKAKWVPRLGGGAQSMVFEDQDLGD